MAYIGKSPTGAGVRSRFHFTATGGETSLSGADDNSKTLVFSDGEYVDVYLNGVLLFDGDYNTTTANTIGGLDALTASDVVEIVVYDTFSVADTVSAKNGGTFSGDVTVNGDLTVDTDTLHVDSANDRVGVGTTSPDKTLHVSKSNSEFRIDNAGTEEYTISTGLINGAIFHTYYDRGNSSYIDNITRATSHIWRDGSGNDKLKIDTAGQIHAEKIYNGFDTTKYYNTNGNESSAVTSFSQTDYDSRGWWLVGIIGMHMPASNGKRYIHCKTNLISTGKMVNLRLEGYLYNAGNLSEDYGLYMYTGSTILNKWRVEKGSTTAGIYNVYKASGGELVIVIDCGLTSYTSASARLYAQGQNVDDAALGKNFSITSITRSTATTAQY